MPTKVATIDFHVTSECSQSCPYCWGPQDFEHPVDTQTAKRIIDRIKDAGATRIVFTGGDPLQRKDIGKLIRHAKEIGLEAALSTTGDELTKDFLEKFGKYIDLISLPLDGPNEEINTRTKEEGHFDAIIKALEWLRSYPEIDVKLCTPVTRHNLKHIPGIVSMAEKYSQSTEARVFYNIFQAFPRAMSEVEWDELLVTDAEFKALAKQLSDRNMIRLNFLSHATLDRLYVMIFPDGNLTIPSGQDFLTYGQFLDVDDLDVVLAASQFDSDKHLHHSRGWKKLK